MAAMAAIHMNVVRKSIYLLVLLVLLVAWGAGSPSFAQAPFPFFEGFESGVLSNYWSTSSTANGRIRIITSNQPYEGARHLVMDATNYVYSRNELILNINLAGETNVFFSCVVKDFGDEHELMPTQFTGSVNADGIAVSSDGVVWHRVAALVPSYPPAFSNVMVNLSAFAASRGIPLNGSFRIKFQQYDDFPVASDGWSFDGIRLFEGSTAADLSVRVSDSPDPCTLGSNLTYSILVSNAGPAAAANVVLTNQFAASASLVSVVSSRGSWITNGASLVFDLGTMPSGTTASIMLTVLPGTVGAITNQAAISSAYFDPNLINNRKMDTTVVDLAGGVMNLQVATLTLDEGRGPYVVRVIRTKPLAGRITVDYATVSETANPGLDFTPVAGTLVFTNGQTERTFVLNILDDDQSEPPESFRLVLSNPTGGAVIGANSNLVVTIRDNDNIATVPFSDTFESTVFSNVWSTYTTGNLGPVITTSNQPLSGLRHVNMNGDYLGYALNELTLSVNLEGREGVYLSFWHKRLSFDEWEDPMPATFTGQGYYDGVALSVDGTNWYRLHGLQEAETGTNEYRQFDMALDPVFAANGLSPNGRVQIKFQMAGYYYPPYYGRFFDDISVYTRSGNLRFERDRWDVEEGAGSVTVIVERVMGDSGAITVDFATSNGAAVAGTDFAGVSGTLIFTNGQRKSSFIVPILQDSEDEPVETFTVHLFNPTGGAHVTTPSQAAIAILDDDGPGEFVFGAAQFVESESAGIASMSVLRRYGSDGAASVEFRTAAGTATPGLDYQDASFTLMFADGVTEQIVEIPLLDDDIIEGSETVLLFLENPQGGASLGDRTNAVLTLLDDEAPRASFPFYEGFESGSLSNYWSLQSTGNGRMVRSTTTHHVFELARSLTMDSTAGYALNEAILTVDLSGQTSAVLRCWTKDFGDPPDPMPIQFAGSVNADGIAISLDGQTWYRALDLGGNGISTAYTNRMVDLAGVARQHNLPLTSTFLVKFQHYGNRLIDAGGRAFDHISIAPAFAPTSTVIRFQGFEGEVNDAWDFDVVPKIGQIHLTSERAHSGNKSLRLIGSNAQNADPYLVFENVSIAAYNNVQLTVAFSALGPDANDDLYLDISYDNGTTWNGAGSVKLVDGFNNATIPFGGVNASDPTTVSSNPWVVDIPSGRSQIKVRFRFDERSDANNAIDRYFIDHVLLSYQPFGQPPRIEPIGDRTAYVSNLLSFVVTADDIDHEPITLTASNLPPGAVFEPFTANGPVSQVFRFVPAESQAGAIYPVVFYATDGDGRHAETVTVRVLDKVVTFAPPRLVMEEGGGSGVVTVRLSRAADALVELTTSGPAGHGAEGDYQLGATSLVFSVDGPVEQVVPITIHDDDLAEGLEIAAIGIAQGLGVITESPPVELAIRDDDSVSIISANLVGLSQRYENPGIRIMQSLLPDVIAIQEFNVTNAGGHRAFVDQTFGTNFHFYVEPGSLPNGVISRWPIVAAGIWDDPSLSQREFVWATLDVPGGRPLHVVSVHLYYSGGSGPREASARALTNYLAMAGYHPRDLVVVCGDMNTQTRNEMAIQVLKAALSDDRKPADQFGFTDTNQNRNKPYDYVLPHPYLNGRHLPVHVGGMSFPEGLVYDTRLWNHPSPPAPALITDSATPGMTHMAVKKNFALDREVTILTQAGLGGTISPDNPDIPVGSNQVFTITAAPYFEIKQLSTNKVRSSTSGGATEWVVVWSNVQENGWFEVEFVESKTPQHVPYHWLAGYGLTNQAWALEAADDQDGDGALTWEEYIADTNPTNQLSRFEIETIVGGTGQAITFVSSTARIYRVEHAPDPAWTGNWQILVTGLYGADAFTTVVDVNSTSSRVYRVNVSLP